MIFQCSLYILIINVPRETVIMSEFLDQCPICSSQNFNPYLEISDWFFSKEKFSLVKCMNCGLVFVNPRPVVENIGNYYDSDEYLSHGLRNKRLIDRIYGIIRKRSIRIKLNLVKSFISGSNILDIGCGTGEFLSYCKQHGLKAWGVEPNERGRNFAIKGKLNVADSLLNLDIIEGTIDCITMWHVLEHIHDLNETMRELYYLLSNDGILIIAVPNCNSRDARYFKEYWAAYDVPRHLYHFSNDTISQLAEKFGYNILKVIPQKLDAYYISMLSIKYKYNKMCSWLFPIYGFWFNLRSHYDKNGYSSLIFVLKKKKS